MVLAQLILLKSGEVIFRLLLGYSILNSDLDEPQLSQNSIDDFVFLLF
jgi:hypothetical protein